MMSSVSVYAHHGMYNSFIHPCIHPSIHLYISFSGSFISIYFYCFSYCIFYEDYNICLTTYFKTINYKSFIKLCLTPKIPFSVVLVLYVCISMCPLYLVVCVCGRILLNDVGVVRCLAHCC